jgi:TonB family protein
MPDLSGLPALTAANYAIVEVRISEQGRVTEDCLLRGIRTDVDTRVLAAVRAWQFNPPRLKFEATVAGKRLPVGTTVPIFMTVSVKVGT